MRGEDFDKGKDQEGKEREEAKAFIEGKEGKEKAEAFIERKGEGRGPAERMRIGWAR